MRHDPTDDGRQKLERSTPSDLYKQLWREGRESASPEQAQWLMQWIDSLERRLAYAQHKSK